MVREMKHTEIGEIPAEWELQTFEETFRMLSNNTLPRADLNNQGGTVLNVHYGDILTRFGEVLDCEKDEVPYLNDGALLTASAQVLQDGDVILADTAEDDTVGKAAEIYGLGKGRMVAGLHTIPCRVKKGDFAPKWLGYYMNSPIYHNQMLPYVTGIKVSSISRAAISETLIAVPPIEEQKVIVSALSEVDRLLVELKKVVSKLRDFKRGCLYLMFPQEGLDVPQMREPGYGEPWEQCKLGELAEKIYGGGTPRTSEEEFWNGNIPWFQSADLTEHEVQSAIPKKGITEIGLQKSAAQLIPGNSIAIVTRVGVGKVVFMPFSYATSQDFLSLSELNCDEKFVCYAIYKLLQKEKNLTQGTSIKGITKEELLNKKIKVPYREEQKKIRNYFTELDHLITLHQQKFDKYAQIKKAMMSELITGKIKLV